MIEMYRNRVLACALLVWSTFIPLALLMHRRDLYILLNCITVSATLTVIYSYWPAMRVALNKNQSAFDIIDFLTLGIMCLLTGMVVRIGHHAYTRMFYEYPPVLMGVWGAFALYIITTGCMLLLSAKRVVRGVPMSSWPRAVFALVSGTVTGLGLIWYGYTFNGF